MLLTPFAFSSVPNLSLLCIELPFPFKRIADTTLFNLLSSSFLLAIP